MSDMKKIAESLGMAEPNLSVEEYSIDGQDVVSTTNDFLPAEQEIQPIDDSKEDAIIDDGHEKTDDIIKHTMSNAKHIAELARDYEPRSQARMYEVGGQYYKIALDAIKMKQDAAHKSKQHNLDKVKTGAPNSIVNAQQNNFYGTREEVLKMLEEQNNIIDAEDNNENDS